MDLCSGQVSIPTGCCGRCCCADGGHGFSATFTKTHLLGVYRYGGFLKWGYPRIIHFHGIFHYKPSIWGYPHLWKPPYVSFVFFCLFYSTYLYVALLFFCQNSFSRFRHTQCEAKCSPPKDKQSVAANFVDIGGEVMAQHSATQTEASRSDGCRNSLEDIIGVPFCSNLFNQCSASCLSDDTMKCNSLFCK